MKKLCKFGRLLCYVTFPLIFIEGNLYSGVNRITLGLLLALIIEWVLMGVINRVEML